MNIEDEQLISPPFEIRSLEEAATYDFLELQENVIVQDEMIQNFFKASYLEQVYFLIRKAIVDKGWVPANPGLMITWEDKLENIFLNQQKELNNFIPNCEKPGYTMSSIMWTIICGLSLLNHTWRGEEPWKKLYNQGGTGTDLPWALENFLVLSKIPVISHTVHDLMGELFVLTSKFRDLEYHPELEVWLLWLQARTAELMYTVSTRDVYNSAEFCSQRPTNPDLFGVSDEFIQETSRLFAELKGTLYRYKIYPRLQVCVSTRNTSIRVAQVDFPNVRKIMVPFTGNLYFHQMHTSSFFYEREDLDKPGITKNWKIFVETCLKKVYHDRSRKTMLQQGLVQDIRPGEVARTSASNQGVSPGVYETLKKNRTTGTLDHLEYHAFRLQWEKISELCCDLERKSHRLHDSIFLHLVDQYMHQDFEISFLKYFCRQEHEWEHDYDSHEREEYPNLLQIMGGWDVYFRGEVIQVRNVMRAFIVWCRIIASRFDGNVYKFVSLRNVINLLQNGESMDISPSPQVAPKAPQELYWI